MALGVADKCALLLCPTNLQWRMTEAPIEPEQAHYVNPAKQLHDHKPWREV